MADILYIAERSCVVQGSDDRRSDVNFADADIIIFPGVRYEHSLVSGVKPVNRKVLARTPSPK